MEQMIFILAALLGALSATAKTGNTIMNADDSASMVVKKDASDIHTLCSAMRIRFTDDDSDMVYHYSSPNISITYTEGAITCTLGDVKYEIYDTASSNTAANYLFVKEVSNKEIVYYGEFSEEADEAYFQANKIKAHDITEFLKNIETLKKELEKMIQTKIDLASS